MHNCRDVGTPQVSVSGWVGEGAMVFAGNGLLCSHEKEGALPFVTARKNLEDILLCEISLTERPAPHDFN